MAAPSNTKWGSIVGSYGRIGISATTSSSNTTTSVHVEVWFWSKYSVSDTNNTYYYNNNSSSATTSYGSKSIKTTVDSGSGWSTSNQVLLAETDYSYSRGTSASTKNCAAKLTGIEAVGGTMTVSTSYTIPALTSYKITFNANGGSGAPGQQTKYYGKTLTLSTTKPTRTGYTFQGWGTSATGSVVYASGGSYTANASDTLYAIWKANTYTVSYNANGGSGAPGNQTKTYGVTLTLSSTKPTRTNYNFKGWGTSSGSTTVAYAAGASYTANAAVTLYAIWELAYVSPIITNLTADRCNSSGTLTESGTYAKVVFNWKIDATNSGGLTSIVIQWKQTSSSTWSSVTAVSGGTAVSGTVSKVVGENSLNTEYDYDVKVTITDSKGNAVFSTIVPAISYLIDFLKGGKGVAFGKPSDTEDLMDINYNVNIRKHADFDTDITVVNDSVLSSYRLQSGQIGFYSSHDDAKNELNRKACVGLNNTDDLYIEPEGGRIRLASDVYFASDPEPDRYNLKLSSGSGNYADNVYILNEAKGYMAIGCGDNLMDTYGSRLYLEMKDRTTYDMFIRPRANDMTTLGTSAQRWYNIYTSRSVNVSSDRRIKEQFTEFDDRYVKLFESLKPTIYKLKSDSEEKSKLAGFIAQDVEDAMNSCEINKREFGICKHDEESDSYALIYDMFIPLTVNYVQTKQKEFVEYKDKTEEKIQTQQEEIDYLKKQVKELKELVLNLSKGGAA